MAAAVVDSAVVDGGFVVVDASVVDGAVLVTFVVV